jgi:phosphomevalonate kinase
MNAADDVVSAPGKLFLMGEYAVLAGAPAVVAAIDRRVTGRFVPGAAPSSPLVAETVRTVRDALAIDLPDGAPQLDSSALMLGERKLGLGSSAAVAAVAVGATLRALASDLEQSKEFVFDLAFRAHRAAQGGRGSGADVAAAVYGGVIELSRDDDGKTAVRSLPPPPIELVVFSTGVPSPTVDHLRAVERLAERSRATYLTRMSELRNAADRFVRSYEGGNTQRLIAATDAAGEALEALGRDADFPIVIPALGFAAKLARELGGAAKPSGAGGGDVGVAFFADAEAAAAFRNRVPPLGVEILSISTTARGLSRGP